MRFVYKVKPTPFNICNASLRTRCRALLGSFTKCNNFLKYSIHFVQLLHSKEYRLILKTMTWSQTSQNYKV